MESLRKNLSAYTLDDAPEDVRELYKISECKDKYYYMKAIFCSS